MSKIIMSMEDELTHLRAENSCLAERLRLQPTVREIVGALHEIRFRLTSGDRTIGLRNLEELLRRLDESQ